MTAMMAAVGCIAQFLLLQFADATVKQVLKMAGSVPEFVNPIDPSAATTVRGNFVTASTRIHKSLPPSGNGGPSKVTACDARLSSNNDFGVYHGFCKIADRNPPDSSKSCNSGCWYVPRGNGYYSTRLPVAGETFTQSFDLNRRFYNVLHRTPAIGANHLASGSPYGLFDLGPRPVTSEGSVVAKTVVVDKGTTPLLSFHMKKKGVQAGIATISETPKFPNLGFAFGQSNEIIPRVYIHEFAQKSDGKAFVHVYHKVTPPGVQPFIVGLPVQVDKTLSRGAFGKTKLARDAVTSCTVALTEKALTFDCSAANKKTLTPEATLKTPVRWVLHKLGRKGKSLLQRTKLGVRLLGPPQTAFDVVVLPNLGKYSCTVDGKVTGCIMPSTS